MDSEEFVRELNDINKELEIQTSEYVLRIKPSSMYIKIEGGEYPVLTFIETALTRAEPNSNTYFKLKSYLIRYGIRHNEEIIKEAKNNLLELNYKLEFAENNIPLPDNYYLQKRDFDIQLLEKTGKNSELLQELLKKKKKEEDLKNFNIVEHYRKRPFENQ